MVQNVTQTQDKTTEAVLYVLKYYSMFQYPLSVEEITANCSMVCKRQDVNEVLTELLLTGSVFCYYGFYSTETNIVQLAEKRRKANALAVKKIDLAIKAGRLIAAFPFVRFVGISGSLSKGYADNNSDFDFFIITSANRLWICRTILHAFKKLMYLFLQQHKFCMNYFLDISHLRLEEKNIYTAIELKSLIPVAGNECYQKMMQENEGWMKRHLPNTYKKFYSPDKIYSERNVIKSLFETLLMPIGSSLNAWLMKFTDRRWRKKWRKKSYPDSDYDLAFKTTPYHSKNHPANNQKKVLTGLSK